MAQANVHISINGWDDELQVSTLNLQQAYNRHHVFELNALIPTGYNLTVEHLKAVLGEQATIHISTDEGSGGSCSFVGFVDEIIPVWTGRNTTIKVKGFSPSIFMDCVPRLRSFTQKSLGHILNKLMNNYSSKQGLQLNSNNTGDKVDFSVQSQETDYQYLCRLADNYGKLFFYDGEQMHFGNLNELSSNVVPLDFKQEINHIEMSLNLAPLSFKLKAYDLEKSETIKYNAMQEVANNNPVVAATMAKSNCYPNQEIHINHLVNGQAELKFAAKKIAARQAHELVTLRGSSNNPAIKIGSRISIESSTEIMSNGSYIIIEVNHQVGHGNVYNNVFTAVPTGYPFPIRMQQSRNPICGPMIATIKENNDPKGLGRVKVEFMGDEERALSPWLRVIVPYTKNGGLFFLPEIGDQVVIFHEDFNPEKSPFVIGAFYHGKATAEKWKDDNNKKKGIALDKINFLFDDQSGKLTIEAEEIEIKANKKMNLDGGQHLTQKATRIDLNP